MHNNKTNILKIPQGLCGLYSKGIQNEYDDIKFNSLYDNRNTILKNDVYQIVYRKIELHEKRYENKYYNGITIHFDKEQCHAINNLDLVIVNPKKMPISSFLKSISVSYGPCRIDGYESYNYALDLDTHIETTAALFGRKVSHINGKTFVPLCFAPLHPQNLIPIGMEHCELSIDIQVFKNNENSTSFFEKPIEIYGNAYFFTEHVKAAFDVKGEMMIFQNNYIVGENIICGENRIPIHFMNALYCMYFWGFDKTKVTRIQLLIDGEYYYDGTIEALERKKEILGYGHLKPVFIFFTDEKIGTRSMSNVILNTKKEVLLIIDTEQEETSALTIIGINTQPARYMSGFFAMAYSG